MADALLSDSAFLLPFFVDEIQNKICSHHYDVEYVEI